MITRRNDAAGGSGAPDALDSTAAADSAVVTVGVLIHVPQPLAGRVAEVRSAVTEVLEDVPTHVTLVPPATLLEDDLDAFVEHLAQVAAQAPPFEIRLCGTATFQPVTDVVYLRVLEGAAECDVLQDHLRRGPAAIDLRYPYHPHVTLAHDVPQAALDLVREHMSAVDETFTVDRFVLHVERPGEQWQPVREFSLGGS